MDKIYMIVSRRTSSNPNKLYSFATITLIAFYSIFSNLNSSDSIKEREEICYQFLKTKLTSSQGAIVSQLNVGENKDQAHTLLSESIGLIMLYALEVGDQKEFDQQAKLTQYLFMSSVGLLYWEVLFPTKKDSKCNASIDDLRVAAALFLGYEKWNKEEYKELALSLSKSMKKHNVLEGYFVESFCWDFEGESTSHKVDISYLDLPAMVVMEKYDKDWEPILKRSIEIATHALTPSGLFYDKYYIYRGKYYNGEMNLINNIMCAVQLGEVGLPNGKVYEFIKKEWSKNKRIRGRFDPTTGEVIEDYENISIYALVLRLALIEKDFKFARKIYNKITSYQVMNPKSKFYGAFFLTYAHSFDNLQVLLSLAELRKTEKSQTKLKPFANNNKIRLLLHHET